MKCFLTLIFSIISFQLFAQPPGYIDESFGDYGFVLTTPLSNSNNVASAVVLQSDGKIVIAGQTYNTVTGLDFLCIRYNQDGSLDDSFGDSGVLVSDLQTGSDDVALTLALQEDGKIVVGGSSNDGTQKDAALVRYNSDGTLDNSFGVGGVVLTDFESENDDDIRDLEINPLTGKINVGGASFVDAAHSKPVIARYETNGDLDNSFNSNGIRLLWVTDLDYQYQFAVEDIAVKSNGQVTAVGWRNFPSIDWENDYWICRVNSDGSMDESFSSDGDGVAVYNGGFNGNDKAFAISLNADNSFYMAGGGYVDNLNYRFTLFEMNADGTFGDMSTTTDFENYTTPYNEIAYSMKVQEDGKIVLAGTSETSGEKEFALTRFNQDGSLDVDFGSAGHVNLAIGDNDLNECFDMVIQPDNRIVLVGRSDDEIALARFFGEEFVDVDAIELNYPGNGDIDLEFDLVPLDWNNMWGIESFEAQIDTDPNFDANPQTFETSSTGVNWSEGVQANTEYFWRVRAFDGNEWGDYSETWSFTTQSLENFSLISPTDNSDELNFTQQTLNWTELEGAVEYDIQIGTDESFTDYLEFQTSEGFTNTTVEGLLPGTEYFWRVRATDGFSWGDWIGPWSFTTVSLNDFVLLQPTDTEENVDFGLVEFDWSEISGVNDYELQLDSSETFSENPQTYSSTSSSLDVESLAPVTTYFWRVRASNSGITGDWSEVWEFTTSETTDISINELEETSVRVFPNPNAGIFTIEVSPALIGTPFSIKDNFGRTLEGGEFMSIQQKIQLYLPSGVYWIVAKKGSFKPVQMIIQ